MPDPDFHHAATANRLRAARQRRFERVEDAARALRIPLATLYGYENGTRGLRAPTLVRLRAGLGVSIDWLLTGEGGMDAPLPAGRPPFIRRGTSLYGRAPRWPRL